MHYSLGDVLYIVAIVIAALVVASKYFKITIPTVTAWTMRDSTASLLLALARSCPSLASDLTAHGLPASNDLVDTPILI